MNLHEKAQFKISHKWMYGKAGIPTNIPPSTDFTFQIHRIEAKKHKKDEGAPDQSEVGLHVNHNQEQMIEGVTQKASEIAMVDMAMTAVKRSREQLESPPGQQNLHREATQDQTLHFLAKGHQTKHKT